MRRTFYILLIAVFASELTVGVVNVILPLYFRSLQLNMTRLNLIFTLFELGFLFSMVFIGKLSDMIGRKHFVAFSLLLHSVVSFLNAGATKIYEFAILRMLRSVASVSDHVIAPAYVSDIFKDGKGMKLGFLHAFRRSGMAIGGMMGGVFLGLLGFQSAFYFTSALTFVIFLFLVTSAKEPPKQIVKVDIKRKLSPELLKLGIVSIIIWVGIRSLVPTIFPVYISEVFNQPPQIVGVIIGTGFLFFALFNAIGGKLADSIGVKNSSMVSMVVNALPLLLLFFAPNVIIASVLFLIIMAGHGIGNTAISTWALHLSRGHKKAQDYGTYRMISGIGAIPGLVISGFIADILGIRSVFLFGTAIFILSFILIKTTLRD